MAATAGVVFANQEKLRIARLLDDIGVDQIEAGIPVMGGDEAEAVKEIAQMGLKASIMAWNRAVIRDIEASLACGVDAVAVSISASDIHIEHKLQTTRQDVLRRMTAACALPRSMGFVSVNAEDGSRADMDFCWNSPGWPKRLGRIVSGFVTPSVLSIRLPPMTKSRN